MTEEKQAGKPPEHWGASAAKFYADAEGETVVVHLRGGALLTGELVGVDRYDLFVQHAGKTMLIPKHAVEWVERAEG